MRFEPYNTMIRALNVLTVAFFSLCCAAPAQVDSPQKSVTASFVISRPEMVRVSKVVANKASDASNIAIWLTPLDQAKVPASMLPPASAQNPRVVQRNKTFEPHVLVVPVGTVVDFPNKDPFFHNIFSLYDGRRFDLGLYESGSKRSVRFDRPGVSFLFCNIHAEMSAVVLSVETPYYAISDRGGNVVIGDVPSGRYQLNVWYELSSPEQLKELSRVITVSDGSRNLGSIQIALNPSFTPEHKNKYGLDYVPAPNADYNRP